MKNIILLFIISITIFFTSCSKSDDNIEANLLLKKSIETYQLYDRVVNVTITDFIYDGNKLVKLIIVKDDERQEIKYTYTGNLITKEELFKDNILNKTVTYEYNSDDQLIVKKTIDINNPIAYKSEYIYNAIGTILVRNFIGNVTNQNEFQSTSTIYFTNGEVSKIDKKIIISTATLIATYTYDGKNNPLRNVTGMSKIAFTSEYNPGTAQNIDRKVSEQDNTTTRIQYTYNNDNYPITSDESVTSFGITNKNRNRIEYFY